VGDVQSFILARPTLPCATGSNKRMGETQTYSGLPGQESKKHAHQIWDEDTASALTLPESSPATNPKKKKASTERPDTDAIRQRIPVHDT